MIPYSFSFCFSISHFSFCASDRNSYSSPTPRISTSAVSASASVLSTIISSFSPRSMILSGLHASLQPLPILSIITPFTASNFCCTRVAASALGSFHFFYSSPRPSFLTINCAIVEEKSDMANAWAVFARSLQVTRLRLAQPIGGSKVLRHLSQEVLVQSWQHRKSNKNNAERHISVSHSNIRDSLLVQHREIVLAKIDLQPQQNTCHSGSCVWLEEGTW